MDLAGVLEYSPKWHPQYAAFLPPPSKFFPESPNVYTAWFDL